MQITRKEKKEIIKDWVRNSCDAYALISEYDFDFAEKCDFETLCDNLGCVEAYNLVRDTCGHHISDWDTWYYDSDTDTLYSEIEDVVEENITVICNELLVAFEDDGGTGNDELDKLLADEDPCELLVDLVSKQADHYIQNELRSLVSGCGDTEFVDVAYKTTWAWEFQCYVTRTNFFGFEEDVCESLYGSLVDSNKNIVKSLCDKAISEKPLRVPFVVWTEPLIKNGVWESDEDESEV